ncbi:MAG: UDP-2,3-diacylglucosamine diphosphatase [Gemmatimonadetes bacterium]|nr:UDP-2,3-diacylglucosamine diphosphatase [Gemmatimonadota bacterium]
MTRYDFITSDIHLGAVPGQTERAFLEFLEHVGVHGRSLLLAGDLFDFWFEYRTVVPSAHFRVLAALSRLVGAGIPVTLAGGNHDAWGGRFLREEVGLDFRTGWFRTELAGREALVAHGDGLGRGDLRYRILKTILRGRFTIGAFRVLHPDLGVPVARRLSRTETRPGDDPRLRGRARFLEEWARARLAEEPGLGWVICGHSHVPALIQVEPARFYINAGDWLTHKSYVTIDESGVPALREWRTGPVADDGRRGARG